MKEKKGNMLWQLFITFFKIGAFTFGGGYAMIALLEGELVSKKKWTSTEEFLDIVAIAESTPGPVAINSATFIGYRMAGIAGSFLATLGAVLPSFVIIYVISLFFDRFLEFAVVANAFKGIRACVVYLIFSAGWKLFKSMKKKPMEITLLSLTIVMFAGFSLFSVRFSSIWMILACGLVGLIVRKSSDARPTTGERNTAEAGSTAGTASTDGTAKGGDRK